MNAKKKLEEKNYIESHRKFLFVHIFGCTMPQHVNNITLTQTHTYTHTHSYTQIVGIQFGNNNYCSFSTLTHTKKAKKKH